MFTSSPKASETSSKSSSSAGVVISMLAAICVAHRRLVRTTKVPDRVPVKPRRPMTSSWNVLSVSSRASTDVGVIETIVSRISRADPRSVSTRCGARVWITTADSWSKVGGARR